MNEMLNITKKALEAHRAAVDVRISELERHIKVYEIAANVSRLLEKSNEELSFALAKTDTN